MLIFGLLALALSLIVAFVVLRPLWPRARTLAVALALSTAVVALGLYRLLGAPLALDPAMVRTPTTVADAITQLEARLKADPSNVDAWRVLAQAYASQERPADAAKALEQALALQPENPDLLVEAAAARALTANEHRFDAQAVAWLDRALTKNPTHQRALWFKGISYRQAGANAEAATTWQRLLPLVDPKAAAVLRPQINEALAAAGKPLLPAESADATRTADGAIATTSSSTATTAGTPLHIRVMLDASFDRSKVAPSTPVFVIARAAGGPPMPVAVEKYAFSDLPLEVTLDDGDSPMPTAKLSSLKDVEVLARVSLSGSPMKAQGDFESDVVSVSLPHAKQVDLTIRAAK